jgi:spore germination cell wall hydrolase CwlJ-like protein
MNNIKRAFIICFVIVMCSAYVHAESTMGNITVNAMNKVESVSKTATENAKVQIFEVQDIELLAKVIYAEAGAEYCGDDMKYYVGSVVLNRIKSDLFPNTLTDVIFQEGQYDCINTHYFYEEPSDRCYQIAKDLIINGSVLPDEVIWQANFIQGNGVHAQIQNMYFCY